MSNSMNLPLDIASFIVPVFPHALLLPNVVVEEILVQPPRARMARMERRPVNRFIWRGYQIPVVSYEHLLRETSLAFDMPRRSHMIIIHGLTDDYNPPYFALLIQQLPKLVWVTAENLSELKQETLKPTESLLVEFDHQVLAIPDLAYIEKRVKELNPL